MCCFRCSKKDKKERELGLDTLNVLEEEGFFWEEIGYDFALLYVGGGPTQKFLFFAQEGQKEI